MYSDDKLVQYLICALKTYGIKNIIVSPGTQNAAFAFSVQNDSFFQCWSVVDERSAAYLAVGMSAELGKPVVITCTGATASRNYISALTEAYYRKLPVIAITFMHAASKFALEAQRIDRTISQNDIKIAEVFLKPIASDFGKTIALLDLHGVMVQAVRGLGPVHIDIENYDNWSFSTANLPNDFGNMVECLKVPPPELKRELSGKKIGVFIGEHKKFYPQEEKAISDFAQSWNAAVFCDYVSNYHGANKVMTACAVQAENLPDIMIDIGRICGEFSAWKLFSQTEVWRVSGEENFRIRYHNVPRKLFDCEESLFFETFTSSGQKSPDYFGSFAKSLEIPELPLSNSLIAQKLSQLLPKGCFLHLTVTTQQAMNRFNLREDIDCVYNVGGFGIDGSISTLIGQSLANPNRMFFGFIGDLAFFYDMNVLGNRHIGNNVRIIMVNNGKGSLFHTDARLEAEIGKDIDPFIAAAGHFTNGAKGWVESTGFVYMSAETKDEFLEKIGDFCSMKSDKPIVFEVFANTHDELEGLDILNGSWNPEKRQSVCIGNVIDSPGMDYTANEKQGLPEGVISDNKNISVEAKRKLTLRKIIKYLLPYGFVRFFQTVRK